MGEWGFTTDTNYDDQWHIVIGTQTNYGKPIKGFVEGLGIGSIAWCAGGWDWGPPIFYKDWTLRVGEGEMGGFAKEWLYEASGVTQNIDLNIITCSVTAGKTQGIDSNDISNIKDAFAASGTMAVSPLTLSNVTQIDVNIISLTDGNVIYQETIDFDPNRLVKNNYKYAPPKGIKRGITLLTMNFSKRTFAIKAKNVDLTGLSCPLRLGITMSNYIMTGDVGESIVNGPQDDDTNPSYADV